MPDSREAMIAERGRAWMDAVKRKDAAALEEFLGAEYTYTASEQGRFSRSEWLATAPVYDILDIVWNDEDVRLYGDIAVVLSNIDLTARVAGEDRVGTFLITDVWTWRDDRWQVVARSSIRFAKTG